MDNRKIGVFDSGIGGLTVVRALFDALPNEQLIYFGDSLHLPYGNRPKADITRLTTRLIKFLKEKDVKAIVVACNTASSLCIDELLHEAAGIPVIDVLTPGTEAAAKAANAGVGVIATNNAVESGAHKRIIHRVNPMIEVYARGCPLLVPMIEEGLCETEMAYAAARYYLSKFDENKIDCLVLGCTHYPLIINALRAATLAPLFDPAIYAAKALKACLTDMNRLAGYDMHDRHHEFFTSGDPREFDQHVLRILGLHAASERALSDLP